MIACREASRPSVQSANIGSSLLSGAKFSFGKWVRRRAANRRSPFRITRWSESRGELFGACGFSVGDVDQIVGDDAEADPAVHAVTAGIERASEAVTAFGDADAAFRSGAPSLAM